MYHKTGAVSSASRDEPSSTVCTTALLASPTTAELIANSANRIEEWDGTEVGL